jgi:hypothetical protein
MKMGRKCSECKTDMYQDNQGKWFCPECLMRKIDPQFLDEKLDYPDKLKRRYILDPATQQVSIRLPITVLPLRESSRAARVYRSI